MIGIYYEQFKIQRKLSIKMKQLINYLKYWGQLLFLPVYWFSFFFPRNKNIWLFGSTFGRRFADNPRYFYLFLSQNKQFGIHAIWISHSKPLVAELNLAGYEAYWYKSLKGIWYCLRGKVYLFDNYAKDISFYLSGGAKKINLWHGIPLKKIQADNMFDRIRHPSNLKEKIESIPRRISDEKSSHWILTPSSVFTKIFSSAFLTKHVLVCVYPRWDSFFLNQTFLLNSEKKDIKTISSKNFKKVIYYLPTFRESETKFFKVINLNALEHFLQEKKYLLCIKLHCKSKLQSKFKEIQSSYIYLIDANSDPYVCLKKADMLITDYSSVYFDYLITEKPIIFFCYDLDEYLKKEREFYFQYEKVTPGRKVKTWDELKKAIEECNNPTYQEKRLRKAIQTKIYDKQETKRCSYQLYKKVRYILETKRYPI